MSTNKAHWYCFTFVDHSGTTGVTYYSTYMGYEEKDQITAKMMEQASTYAGCENNSTCLIALVYMGHMTEDKFIEDYDYAKRSATRG